MESTVKRLPDTAVVTNGWAAYTLSELAKHSMRVEILYETNAISVVQKLDEDVQFHLWVIDEAGTHAEEVDFILSRASAYGIDSEFEFGTPLSKMADIVATRFEEIAEKKLRQSNHQSSSLLAYDLRAQAQYLFNTSIALRAFSMRLAAEEESKRG